MAFDHGELNVPLSKRSDINAELDRKKAADRKRGRIEAKQLAIQNGQVRQMAKNLVAALSAEDIARFATKMSVSKSVAIRKLRSEAHWNPNAIIRAFGNPDSRS
jgi:hypothetical protein